MSRTLKPCGTVAAWNRHKRRGETPCQPCKDARAAYMRQWHAAHPDARRNGEAS